MPTAPSFRHPFPALPPKAVGVLAAVVTVLIWSSFIVISRAAADPARGGVLTPFDIVYARICGASLVLLPWGLWMSWRERLLASETKEAFSGHSHSLGGLSPLSLKHTLQIGLAGGLIYPMLAYNGFSFAPAAHASVLMPGSLPLWTALLAWLLLGERVGIARASGLALIVAGGLLVGGAHLLPTADGGNTWRGDLLFILASMTWAVYSVLARRFAVYAVRATIAITALAFVLYVPLYTLLLLLHWAPGNALAAPWQDVATQMLFQGVGSVAISGISFTVMIAHFGPVRSTMITALVPGLSALAATVLLAEPLAWNLLGGLALVTAGIVLGVRPAALRTTKSIAVPALPMRL